MQIVKKKIISMIPNEEKEGWYYLAVTKFSASLRGITSKINSGFSCLNCLSSFRTENKLKSHLKYVKTNIFVEL